MHRSIGLALVALLVALLAVPLIAARSEARTIALGAGAFGGTTIPFLQDDAQKAGTQFGLRVPVKVLPIVSFEPFFTSAKLGDTNQDYGGVTYTRDGFSIRTFGLNAALGNLVGGGAVSFYPFGGIGSYKLSRSGSSDVTETGYSGGLGIGIAPTGLFRIDLRGEAVVVALGSTSRKFVGATVGVSHMLWSR